MSNKNKTWLGALAFVFVATALLVRYGALAGSVPGGALFNVNMPAATALNVSVSDKSQPSGAVVNDQQLGGLVHNQQETFDAGFALNSVQVLGADGSLTIPGTSTFSSDVSGVPKLLSTAMSTATSTPCAVLNSSGATRVVTSSFAKFTGGSNAGATFLNVGTSSNSGVTGTTPFIYTTLTKIASRDVISSTSTQNATNTIAMLNGLPGYGEWRNNEYLVWKTATTSNTGTCNVVFYQQ